MLNSALSFLLLSRSSFHHRHRHLPLKCIVCYVDIDSAVSQRCCRRHPQSLRANIFIRAAVMLAHSGLLTSPRRRKEQGGSWGHEVPASPSRTSYWHLLYVSALIAHCLKSPDMLEYVVWEGSLTEGLHLCSWRSRRRELLGTWEAALGSPMLCK